MATPVAAVEVNARTPPRLLPRRVVPGFGLTLGYTMVYLSLIVLIPLSATFVRSMGLGYRHFFIWVIFSALPGLVLALQLKIEPQFGKKSAAA